MSVRTPSYRFHRSSGQAVVTIDGRDHYLGKHNSPDSIAEYDRLISEWLARGRCLSGRAGDSDLTIAEMIVAYVRHADSYYVKGGRPTTEAGVIRLAMKPLRRLYGHTPARDFGPLSLKAVRQAMIDEGLTRTGVNGRVGRIARAFKWASENELVPAAVYHALRTVPGLRKGRCEARESEPVKPVPDARVDAVRPFVSRQVWAIIQLMRLTGMRPGEACLMRTCDLDTSGRVWVYTPHSHKAEHHDKERKVYLGPRAQAVLRPWLRADLSAYLFSPREALEEHRAERRRNRKTPLTPAHRRRRRAVYREREPGDRYTPDALRQAIDRACDRAFPHPTLSEIPRAKLTDEQRVELAAWRREYLWHPHQLRHNAATRLRKEFGLEVARIILGHNSPVVTAIYAEADREKAAAIMERVG